MDLLACCRAAHRRTVLFTVATLTCLLLEALLASGARLEHQVRHEGRFATMTVERVHVGDTSDEVTGHVGAQQVTVRVKPGHVSTGDALDVLYLPRHRHGAAADPVVDAGGDSADALLLGALVVGVLGTLSVRQARATRRLRALARQPGKAQRVLVDYRIAGRPRGGHWVADVDADNGRLTMNLAARPKPRPRADHGLPEPADAWGSLEAGGWALVAPDSGRLVSPNGPLGAPRTSAALALLAMGLLVALAVALLR